jgi:hypothetical protein
MYTFPLHYISSENEIFMLRGEPVHEGLVVAVLFISIGAEV